MSEDFEIWWHNEGSGMPPFKEEETCDHVKRVSAIAWSNGAFKATLYLEAENARLKAEVQHWQEQWHFVIEDNNKQMDELARLRASSFVTAVPVEQYERVVKAGDAVCESPYLWENDPAVIAWRAAKEGKPSV